MDSTASIMSSHNRSGQLSSGKDPDVSIEALLKVCKNEVQRLQSVPMRQALLLGPQQRRLSGRLVPVIRLLIACNRCCCSGGIRCAWSQRSWLLGVLEVRVSGLGFACTVVTKYVFAFAFVSQQRYDFALRDFYQYLFNRGLNPCISLSTEI